MLLKTDPEFFQLVKAGKKTAEIRFNDRDFQEGQRIVLVEYDRSTQSYSGEFCNIKITHVLKDFEGLSPEWVMLSFKKNGGGKVNPAAFQEESQSGPTF